MSNNVPRVEVKQSSLSFSGPKILFYAEKFALEHIQIFSISAQSLSKPSPTQSAINNDLFVCFTRLDSWGVKWWGKHMRTLGWIPGQCIIAMSDGILDIDIGDLCKLHLGLTSMAGLGWTIKQMSVGLLSDQGDNLKDKEGWSIM